MATVYMVCVTDDEAFVVDHLLPDLPLRGLGHWLCARHVAAANEAAQGAAIAQAIGACAVVVVVVSPALAASAWAREEAATASASGRPLVVVQAAAMDDAAWQRLPARLRTQVVVDWAQEGEPEARRLLAGLLPTQMAGDANAPAGVVGEPIRWRETRFSEALHRAARRHDHAAMAGLVDAFAAQAAQRGAPYPAQLAAADLNQLREERAFELLCGYAEAAIGNGTQDAKVHRLYAQGLIELSRFDEALAVLQGIVADPATSPAEVAEAWGLIGRLNKQRYVASCEAAAPQPALLLQAIDAYARVHDQNPAHIWHGVNAASCIRRAVRDGIAGADAERAQRVARQVLATIDTMPTPLQVWDAASRVEALLALERFDEAGQALDVYLAHPAMTAFEVFSTHRQFDQVLQLGRDARGAPLLERLRNALTRYRAGTVSTTDRHGAPGVAAMAEALAPAAPQPAALMPLVLRVASAAWEPGAIDDLVLRSRLGTVVTARGSDRSVRALMADPGVISVEQSRPAGVPDCHRSMPFIRMAAQYTGINGPYAETGDRALIAVIDDGIDVLHEAFLDGEGRSRIVGIWDQTVQGKPPPGFDFGHFHSQADIAGYVAANKVPPVLSRNLDGHGTHVASIAAGRATGTFAGGVAPGARLLIVVSGGAGPVGYSQSHVEALAFIDAQARALNCPVVVNLSQGMNAGAHDGTSPLEVAFDAFSGGGTIPGRVVVKSAGNEGAKDGHARLTLKQGQAKTLTWTRFKGADPVERIELWWKANDTLQMRLGDPFGNWSELVGVGEGADVEERFGPGGRYKLRFVRLHVDNGDSLLAIDLGSWAEPAALGDWKLDILCGVAPDGGEVHAWIERTGGEPSRFVQFAVPEFTLSIPGTAASVIAVGAIDASRPFRLGDFSSYGPTRTGEKKPQICAPGVAVQAARGGTADESLAKDGTSMAAPHVAGAIALLLSLAEKHGIQRSARQIATELRGKAQEYDGRWDSGMGYGVVDIAALLATLGK